VRPGFTLQTPILASSAISPVLLPTVRLHSPRDHSWKLCDLRRKFTFPISPYPASWPRSSIDSHTARSGRSVSDASDARLGQPTRTPLVSVIIPARNEASRLARCLDALAEQDDAPPFAVIVIDNGSTDGTADVAADHDLLPRVLQERAWGAYAARNAGLAVAAGSIFALTNADCVPCRRWLYHGVAALAGGADLVAAPSTCHPPVPTRPYGNITTAPCFSDKRNSWPTTSLPQQETSSCDALWSNELGRSGLSSSRVATSSLADEPRAEE
jgi:hypothetical protein